MSRARCSPGCSSTQEKGGESKLVVGAGSLVVDSNTQEKGGESKLKLNKSNNISYSNTQEKGGESKRRKLSEV